MLSDELGRRLAKHRINDVQVIFSDIDLRRLKRSPIGAYNFTIKDVIYNSDTDCIEIVVKLT